MISAEFFQTFSLRNHALGESIRRILAASIQAVEPGAAVERFVRREGDGLVISDRIYDLRSFRRVVLLGIGKASVAMSATLGRILGDRLEAGLVVTKQAASIPGLPFTVIKGGHPVPDAQSIQAGQKMLEFVTSLGPDDLLFCLISGGGSSLVTTPLEGLRLEDLQATTTALLVCGARIGEMNTLRRHLERLKAGGLVRWSNGATIISLILSDVIGNPLESIASGPTAPDPTTKREAMMLVDKYDLRTKIPAPVLAALEEAPETPKPGDPIFERVQNVIVGSSRLAAEAALAQAEKEGFHPYLMRLDQQGEARQVAVELVNHMRQVQEIGKSIHFPACIIVGGETTVTLHGNGRGGRNTELALAAVPELANYQGLMLVTLATDGEDGPTDAAGAVVTGETCRRASAMGLCPEDFLARNDSHTFFAALEDLLKPGQTGTNVNDLDFLFVF